MFTLLNRDDTLCTGIFPTLEAAEFWANTFLPEFQLKPIELLVSEDTKDAIECMEGWTWSKDRSVEDIVGGAALPLC